MRVSITSCGETPVVNGSGNFRTGCPNTRGPRCKCATARNICCRIWDLIGRSRLREHIKIWLTEEWIFLHARLIHYVKRSQATKISRSKNAHISSLQTRSVASCQKTTAWQRRWVAGSVLHPSTSCRTIIPNYPQLSPLIPNKISYHQPSSSMILWSFINRDTMSPWRHHSSPYSTNLAPVVQIGYGLPSNNGWTTVPYSMVGYFTCDNP